MMDRRPISGGRALASLLVLIGIGALGGWWVFQATVDRVCYAFTGGIDVPGQPTRPPVQFDYPPEGCVAPDILTGAYPPPANDSAPRPGIGYLMAGGAVGGGIWIVGVLLAPGSIGTRWRRR